MGPDRRSGRTPDYGRQPSGAYPPRNQSMTPSSGPGRPSPGTSPRPPVGGAPPGGPMSAPPSSNSTPKPAAAAATPPPKKGPKTFEEMGVPQGKTDSDCVSSISSNHNMMTRLITDTNSDCDVIPDDNTFLFNISLNVNCIPHSTFCSSIFDLHPFFGFFVLVHSAW